MSDHIIPRSSNEVSSTWRRPLLRSPVMFSLFRFTITLCVTFAVVQGFCNSHPRWWPNRQQNLAKCTESRDFLERMQRCHISMKESSSSTDISSSPIAKGLQTGNISAFLDFDGASDIIMSSDGKSKNDEGSLGATPRKYFLPKELENATPEMIWEWWQKRGQQESLLKNAIVSAKKDIRPDFEEFRPFLSANKAEILQCQSDFCRAIAETDEDLMRSIWLDSPDSMCFKAGGAGAVVTGYENILDVWSASFAAVGTIPNLRTKDIRLNFQGDTAIVTCVVETETISESQRRNRSPKKRTSTSPTNFLMTNIFVKPHNTDRYCLSAHITSVDPADTDTNTRAAALLKETYQDPMHPPRKRSQGGGMLGMAGGTIHQLLNGAIIRQRGQDDDDDGEDEDGDDDDSEEDEDDDEDDDDEDDDDEDQSMSPRALSNQRLKNTFRDTVNRLVENGGGGGRVMIIGNNGLSSFIRGNNGVSKSKSRGNGKGVSTIEMDDDDDSEDEEGENEVKELAARTLLAVRWLHTVGRLSDIEKRCITGDIIRNVGEGEFSRAEIAYSLLIGSGLPGEPKQVSGPNSPGWDGRSMRDRDVPLVDYLGGSSSTSGGFVRTSGSGSGGEESFDMSLIADEDMSEFEDVCRVIANGVLAEKQDIDEDDDDDSEEDEEEEDADGQIHINEDRSGYYR